MVTLSLLVAILPLSLAKIKTETVEYKQDQTTLEGFLAYDDQSKAMKPGAVIFHDWMGISDFTKEKAIQMAKMGYIAFAADMFGKNIRPKNHEEAAKAMTTVKTDLELLRKRTQAALDQLQKNKSVDPSHIIAFGFCFGGTCALELGRTGAPLTKIASFHGGLATPRPEDAKNIKGKVLIMHGAEDPFVPAKEVEEFKKGMAHVNMKFISYPGAVHAFTNPMAGSDKSKGLAYNPEVAKKAWDDFTQFIK